VRGDASRSLNAKCYSGLCARLPDCRGNPQSIPARIVYCLQAVRVLAGDVSTALTVHGTAFDRFVRAFQGAFARALPLALPSSPRKRGPSTPQRFSWMNAPVCGRVSSSSKVGVYWVPAFAGMTHVGDARPVSCRRVPCTALLLRPHVESKKGCHDRHPLLSLGRLAANVTAGKTSPRLKPPGHTLDGNVSPVRAPDAPLDAEPRSKPRAGGRLPAPARADAPAWRGCGPPGAPWRRDAAPRRQSR
jgi:hypothetical protein